MRPRSENGHERGKAEAMDDATVEELLAGRYEGDAPGLLAVSRLLEHIRSFADQPVPPPSPPLARVLGPSDPSRGDGRVASSSRALRVASFKPSAGQVEDTASGHRSSRSLVPAIALATAALVAVVLGAGSARVLPGPTQHLVAKVVHTLTPFDFPEQKRPEAVQSRAGTPEAASPSGRDTPTPVVPSLPDPSGPGGNGGQSVDRDGMDGGSDATAVKPAPAPTTTTSLAPLPRTAPTPSAPKTTPDTVTTTVPASPTRGPTFSADLAGATGTEAAGDADGRGRAVVHTRQGRDEVCMALAASGIGPVTSAHLHVGTVGGNGRVVATFPELVAGSPARCVAVADEVIKTIRKDPAQFYVDVHTSEFPNGAIRGQLTK